MNPHSTRGKRSLNTSDPLNTTTTEHSSSKSRINQPATTPLPFNTNDPFSLNTNDPFSLTSSPYNETYMSNTHSDTSYNSSQAPGPPSQSDTEDYDEEDVPRQEMNNTEYHQQIIAKY